MSDQQPHLPVEAGRSTPRTPGLVNSAIALGMTVLLAAVALTVRQPPPPAIAEFAPQAVEQIKEAPSEQSSEFGSSGGSGSNGETPPSDDAVPDDPAATTTTTTTTPGSPEVTEDDVEVASIRRCIGNPPRQTEDPRAPPCVPFFEGDNGGATSFGVTAETIKIGMPLGPVGQASPDPESGVVAALFAHFNSRYEFYGRKLVPVFYNINGQGQGGPNRPAQRASADTAKERGVFASTSVYLSPGYYERLPEHSILGTYRTPDYTDSYLAENNPFLWGYYQSASQTLSGIADWACARLVGGNAVHAGMSGAVDLTTKPRKFAILMQITDEANTTRADPLKKALEACGAEVPYILNDFANRVSGNRATVNTEITKMRDLGVTSVISLLELQNMENYQNAATVQNFTPEWIVSSYPQAYSGYWGSRNPDQMEHAFGVMFRPMERVAEDHPSVWALLDGGFTEYERTSLGIIQYDITYQDLLVLASGIQMAGPNLTPETFRDALRRTKFPNPDHPIMVGKVGFQEGDFSMANDAVEVWFDRTASGPYEDMRAGTGAFCWVNGGARRARGTWEKGVDPFFKREGCDYGVNPVS